LPAEAIYSSIERLVCGRALNQDERSRFFDQNGELKPDAKAAYKTYLEGLSKATPAVRYEYDELFGSFRKIYRDRDYVEFYQKPFVYFDFDSAENILRKGAAGDYDDPKDRGSAADQNGDAAQARPAADKHTYQFNRESLEKAVNSKNFIPSAYLGKLSEPGEIAREVRRSGHPLYFVSVKELVDEVSFQETLSQAVYARTIHAIVYSCLPGDSENLQSAEELLAKIKDKQLRARLAGEIEDARRIIKYGRYDSAFIEMDLLNRLRFWQNWSEDQIKASSYWIGSLAKQIYRIYQSQADLPDPEDGKLTVSSDNLDLSALDLGRLPGIDACPLLGSWDYSLNGIMLKRLQDGGYAAALDYISVLPAVYTKQAIATLFPEWKIAEIGDGEDENSLAVFRLIKAGFDILMERRSLNNDRQLNRGLKAIVNKFRSEWQRAIVGTEYFDSKKGEILYKTPDELVQHWLFKFVQSRGNDLARLRKEGGAYAGMSFYGEPYSADLEKIVAAISDEEKRVQAQKVLFKDKLYYDWVNNRRSQPARDSYTAEPYTKGVLSEDDLEKVFELHNKYKIKLAGEPDARGFYPAPAKPNKSSSPQEKEQAHRRAALMVELRNIKGMTPQDAAWIATRGHAGVPEGPKDQEKTAAEAQSGGKTNGGFSLQGVADRQQVDTAQGQVVFSRDKALTQWKDILGIELVTVALRF